MLSSRRIGHPCGLVAAVGLLNLTFGVGMAQPPAPEAYRPPDAGMSLRPLPPVGIPDDPPPHEGALIDLPLVIEPPDIVIVEVLETLPGRPITGERLVRSDGTISLGFYGDVHLRGLTSEQAKVKIVLHLRRFLNDQVLGLQVIQAIAPGPKAGDRPATAIPPDNRPFEKPDLIKPGDPPPVEAQPSIPAKPSLSRRPDGSHRVRSMARRDLVDRPGAGRGLARPILFSPQEPRPIAPKADDVGDAFRDLPRDPAPPEMDENSIIVLVDPKNTVRVFVDLASHNSKVYFVQGDVGSPGRLPFVGNETVLDAMNFAGGLIPTAEPADIHLYRPARGDVPVRDYHVDWRAILRGEKQANLQIFPGDRLVVGRNAIVQKTIEIDRAAAPINSVFNTALGQSFLARSMAAAMGDVNGTTQAQRDEVLKRWVEVMWGFPSNGAPLNPEQQALRDTWMKKLDSRAEAKERAGIKPE